ncbi:MAG: DNA glycosylase AlkZ-like family protein, partial [Acidimicrobiaceae bacterium]
MPARIEKLSVHEARKLALAAQGFDLPRTKTKSTTADVVALIKKLSVIQIDSVNVLVRSQELPLFSRLGDHDRDAIPKATAQGKIFEYWGHEAAHLPVELQPMFRFKMHAARSGKLKHWGSTSFYTENRAFVQRTLKHVVNHGPTTARELS